MSDAQVQPNPERDPEDWVTGDEPMTGPQASYLQTLCQEGGGVRPQPHQGADI